MKKSIKHDGATFAVGHSLKAFMSKAGIQEHKQADFISKALGVSATHAYRKMRDSSPWEIGQLQILLSKMGYSLSEFFSEYEKEQGDCTEALIDIQNQKYKCTIYFAEDDSNAEHDFSALQINGKWYVQRTTELIRNNIQQHKRNIEKITIISEIIKHNKLKIALLDDDVLVTNTLQEGLKSEYFSIDTFSSSHLLEEEIKNEPYDAYVIDWVLEDKNAFSTVKKIRETSKPDALILVLTGQLGFTIDDQISRAINDYDVVGPYEKPVRLGVLKTIIEKYFNISK